MKKIQATRKLLVIFLGYLLSTFALATPVDPANKFDPSKQQSGFCVEEAIDAATEFAVKEGMIDPILVNVKKPFLQMQEDSTNGKLSFFEVYTVKLAPLDPVDIEDFETYDVYFKFNDISCTVVRINDVLID